jgi:PleD family two-component response regulator
VLARWGGEAFLLMLPNTALPEATQVLRRMAGGSKPCASPNSMAN